MASGETIDFASCFMLLSRSMNAGFIVAVAATCGTGGWLCSAAAARKAALEDLIVRPISSQIYWCG